MAALQLVRGQLKLRGPRRPRTLWRVAWTRLRYSFLAVILECYGRRSHARALHPSALFGWPTFFPIGNLADGMAGALLTKWLLAGAVLPHVRGVIQFIAAAAVGAAVGALLGALGAVHVLEDTTYLHQWQLWWTGNWLGSLAIAPVVFTWRIRWHTPDHAVLPVRAGECVLLAAVLVAATAWIFYSAPGSPTSLLQLPSVLVAITVVVAFRLPPRWSVTLSAAAVLLAAQRPSICTMASVRCWSASA